MNVNVRLSHGPEVVFLRRKKSKNPEIEYLGRNPVSSETLHLKTNFQSVKFRAKGSPRRYRIFYSSYHSPDNAVGVLGDLFIEKGSMSVFWKAQTSSGRTVWRLVGNDAVYHPQEADLVLSEGIIPVWKSESYKLRVSYGDFRTSASRFFQRFEHGTSSKRPIVL